MDDIAPTTCFRNGAIDVVLPPMGIKSLLARPFARLIAAEVRRWSSAPFSTQDKVFRQLMLSVSKTAFGRDHHLTPATTYAEFRHKVPVRDYEGLRPYLERVANGEADVTWPGKPIYLSKTSGTTSGVKYIPISKDSISNHINSARNALLMYIAETGKARFVDGKLIFPERKPGTV